MKGKKLIFDFKQEDVDFMNQVIRKGELNVEDKRRMTSIYRMRIDPNQPDICEGCNQIAKQNFRRLERIMCESLGVKELLNVKVVKVIETEIILKGPNKKPFEVGEDNYPKQPVKVTTKGSIISRIGEAIKKA